MRHVFRLALGALALYLYFQGSIFWAAWCVIVLATSVLGQDISRLFALVGRLANVPQEHDANCILNYTISLQQVFEHPAVNDLFAKLRKRNKAPVETLEEWHKLLAASYARKYKRDDLVWEVRFNIKSNLLFVNGEPNFRDYVYAAIEIPYRWTGAGEPQEASRMDPEIESELSVRTLLLSGMLILQVGFFSKEYSPHVWSRGLPAYETYTTLTAFPLMYFSDRHGIPARYLNVIAQATASYAADERGSASAKGSDKYRDWKTLHQDLAVYRRLCEWDKNRGMNSSDIDTWEKLRKGFEEKYTPLLAAEGYKSSRTEDTEDDWGDFPDFGYTYWNKYGRVFFHDMNANRGSHHEAEWLAGYYEERP